MIYKPRFLGFAPDGRRRYACDYEADLRPVAGGADPESNDQIDASEDDAYEREITGAMNLTGGTVWAEDNASSGARYWGGLRFHNGPFPAKGSTVDVARISVYIGSADYDDANLDIHAEDGAGPATFTTTGGNLTGRTRTTASTPWVANSIGTGWHDSPSIVSVIQELVTDYSPTAIVLILKPKGEATKMLDFQAWDCGDPSAAAKLHLEWTEGGPPVGQPTMRRWGGIPGMVYTGRAGW